MWPWLNLSVVNNVLYLPWVATGTLLFSRKRRGGIKLGQEEDEEEVSDDSCEPVEDSELDKLRKEKQEASSKARIEDLWADFKKDTKTTPARKTSSTASLKVR